MYVAAVLGLMLAGPAASTVIEAVANPEHLAALALVGKWFVFWAIGVRLFTAGLRQVVRPGLTSEGILGIEGESWRLVRELGFANLAIGTAAIVSLAKPEWRLAAALTGGLFLTLDGVLHLLRGERGFEENLAMVSDLAIGLLMAVYLIGEL